MSLKDYLRKMRGGDRGSPPRSPFAQPRNLVGGHLLSAIVGVLCWRVLHPYPGLAAALAVSTAIAAMHLTATGEGQAPTRKTV